MEEQQIFATVWRGFDKQTVIDYIYEQDVLFKKKEADLTKKIEEYESKIDELNYSNKNEESPEIYRERIESLKHTYMEQCEVTASLQEQCDKLRRETDQLSQIVRSKDGELQLQTELNRQLQMKCDVLEGKLKILAEHLLSERESMTASLPTISIEEPIIISTQDFSNVDINTIPEMEGIQIAPEIKAEVTDLKGELNEFRASVSETLLNFEAALARLEADKSFLR